VATEHILPAIARRLAEALAGPTQALCAFIVDGHTVGWLDVQRAGRLREFGDVFRLRDNVLTFVADLCDAHTRTVALARVARVLASERRLTAWRDERYAVAPAFGAPACFLLERAAARYFGVHTYAAHVNGYVRREKLELWFARRSPTKAIDPGQLDNLVGGGIAADAAAALGDDAIRATVIKESWEEAGIRADVAAGATGAGTIDICRTQPDGLQRETIFVHDLELPGDFEPRNQDGEAVEHRRVSLDEAARLIAIESGSDVVTADASLVVLDFLLRHGAITDDAPERAALISLLHATTPALGNA
jgi:8-oxo-dGTP pyrophosphatase MutT (NUDIX family)